METLNVSAEQYDNIEGFNDLEGVEEIVDNIGGAGKRKAKRVRKRTARRVKRRTKKATRLQKKGKGKRAKKVLKRSGKLTKRKEKRAVRLETKGSLAERLACAPLLPLRPMMIKELGKKGIKLKKKAPIVQVADLFFNKIVTKSRGSKFEEIPYVDTYYRDDDHAAAAISAIVSGIIDFVKSLKKKKASGEKLTTVEAGVVQGTEIAEVKLRQKAKEEAAKDVGSKLLFDKKTQLIIGGVVLTVIIVSVYLARKK